MTPAGSAQKGSESYDLETTAKKKNSICYSYCWKALEGLV